jgi:hypothetical protein
MLGGLENLMPHTGHEETLSILPGELIFNPSSLMTHPHSQKKMNLFYPLSSLSEMGHMKENSLDLELFRVTLSSLKSLSFFKWGKLAGRVLLMSAFTTLSLR